MPDGLVCNPNRCRRSRIERRVPHSIHHQQPLAAALGSLLPWVPFPAVLPSLVQAAAFAVARRHAGAAKRDPHGELRGVAGGLVACAGGLAVLLSLALSSRCVQGLPEPSLPGMCTAAGSDTSIAHLTRGQSPTRCLYSQHLSIYAFLLLQS